MRQVTIDKNKLLETVKANREKHVETYKKTLEGYHQALLAEIEFAITALNDLKIHAANKISQGEAYVPPDAKAFFDRNKLKIPSCHADSYDQVISMLEYSTDDKVVLEHYDFKQYVMDQWDWSEYFGSVSKTYTGR